MGVALSNRLRVRLFAYPVLLICFLFLKKTGMKKASGKMNSVEREWVNTFQIEKKHLF